MKRLEFNFFKSLAPEEMLARLKNPKFIEAQKSALIIRGHSKFNNEDVEVSIGFLLNDSDRDRERTEYDTIIIKNANTVEDIIDGVMKYIDANIIDLVLLLKLN